MSTQTAFAPFPGMLVGPLLWVLLFIGSYLISGIGCALTGEESRLQASDVRFMLYCAVGMAGAGIIACGIAQLRWLLHLSRQKASSEASQPAMLLCGVATLLSVVVLVGIFWLGLNISLTPTCTS